MAIDVQHAVPDDEAALNTDINTTPLVDVMLVMLIIFLVTIPVIVKTIPVATAASCVSMSDRFRVMRGSSWTSIPSPCPVPWPNASARPCRARVSRAAASISNRDRPGATLAMARSWASSTAP